MQKSLYKSLNVLLITNAIHNQVGSVDNPFITPNRYIRDFMPIAPRSHEQIDSANTKSKTKMK